MADPGLATVRSMAMSKKTRQPPDPHGSQPRPPATPEPSRGVGDRALVLACLRGDEQAWQALIRKYKNLIFSIPLKYGATPEDAADIFQLVCLELYTDLARLRNTDNLRPWLMTVTAHQAFHWKRKMRRQPRADEELLQEAPAPDSTIPAALYQEAEREQLVREAVTRLSERCQRLVRMLFYEQPPLPYAQVAQRLGLAVGSVGFIRARCLKSLQRALVELGF